MLLRTFGLFAIAAALTGAKPAPAPAMDKDNPSCPAAIDWGQAKAMTLMPADVGGKRVLLADGIIDASLPTRLKAAIDADDRIEEIWVKSRGGDARAGNAAGKVIRSYPGMVTRIPKGSTCFSACNFVFMGGDRRFVDPGGIFMVHMFTHTGDRDAIELSVEEGTEETTRLIGEIEQSSAMLASEDNDFLIRMGISRKLLTEIMYKQQAVASTANRSTRYCLNQEEVRKYNVMPMERAE
ncbi:hypothetical protein OLX02_08430 [Novosphingobium sp. KCTC 2891]|uniref:COG3904 family protein n=1 Tax=Novosphingobium sp. KCTC 2891 TaxID=2989730 RepID=UPI00222206C8|nr:hypothetical protein [Novosphingobium sp. KCTC 2891]MCW1382848.1 hypothetical protein [Novosphingobium sp. KCTC 2891]